MYIVLFAAVIQVKCIVHLAPEPPVFWFMFYCEKQEIYK